MNWFLGALKKYADFKGRARRKEYWMFTLFYIIFMVVAIILDNVFGIANKQTYYGPIYYLYVLAFFLPTLAVSARRLHDTGKSGWMIFINLIPIAGAIWFLVLMASDGQPGDNKYGSNPKA